MEKMLGRHAAPRAGRRRPRGLRRLWHFATEYLIALPLGAAVALVWANVWPESYFRTVFGLGFFVNDVAMVFFFGLVTKEIVEATAPGGVLHSWRRVLLPAAGAAGMTAAAIALFAGMTVVVDHPRLAQGWPAAAAVDLALVYFAGRLLFGRHPIVPFLLLLAIAANAFGFAAIAVSQPASQIRLDLFGLLMGGAVLVSLELRRRHVRSFWPYVLAGGGLSWAALYFGGFHPALALLPVIPFVPHAARDRGFFVDATPGDRDPLSRLELWLRHPAQAALFLFGVTAAGVPLQALDAGTWALPVAVLAGRPIGLLLGVAIALAAGLHLPARVTVRHVVVAAFICAGGFTMALFFANAVLGPGPVLSEMKMGGLLTAAAILPALAAARLLRVGRFGGEAV